MSSQYYKTEGLVIKKVPYGEADFLVRVFAKNFGKIDLIAKGARKPVSKLNPHLDILNFIRLSFVKNGERLSILTDAEIIDKFEKLFYTSDNVALASRILQTIDIILPQEQEDNELLVQILSFLPKNALMADKQNETEFLRRILAHEGYGQEVDLNVLPKELAEGIMKLWPA